MISRTRQTRSLSIFAVASLLAIVIAAGWMRYLYVLHRDHIIEIYRAHQEELVSRVAASTEKQLEREAAQIERIAGKAELREVSNDAELSDFLDDRLRAAGDNNLRGLVIVGESGPPLAEARGDLPHDWPDAKLLEFINSVRGEVREQPLMSEAFSVTGSDKQTGDYVYAFIAVPAKITRIVEKKVVVQPPVTEPVSEPGGETTEESAEKNTNASKQNESGDKTDGAAAPGNEAPATTQDDAPQTKDSIRQDTENTGGNKNENPDATAAAASATGTNSDADEDEKKKTEESATATHDIESARMEKTSGSQPGGDAGNKDETDNGANEKEVQTEPAAGADRAGDAANNKEKEKPAPRVVVKQQRQEEDALLLGLVDLREISYSAQRLGRADNISFLFMISGAGTLLSHPENNFIGADSAAAFNLGHYVELNDVIEKMKSGESGHGVYYSPDSRTGAADTKWMIAYEPVSFGGRTWSAGAAFEVRRTPFLKGLSARYTFAVVFVLAVLLVANFLLIREKKRLLETDRKAVKLGDTAALNEILTSVNSELTEEKRKLETRTAEFKSIIRERESDIEKMDVLFEQLAASIEKPAKKQRDIISEIRGFLKILRRPIESRFNKKD